MNSELVDNSDLIEFGEIESSPMSAFQPYLGSLEEETDESRSDSPSNVVDSMTSPENDGDISPAPPGSSKDDEWKFQQNNDINLNINPALDIDDSHLENVLSDNRSGKAEGRADMSSWSLREDNRTESISIQHSSLPDQFDVKRRQLMQYLENRLDQSNSSALSQKDADAYQSELKLLKNSQLEQLENVQVAIKVRVFITKIFVYF